MRVDAHHHLWRYTVEEYGWIDDPMAALKRDFLSSDLEAEAHDAGVEASVAVQARQTLEETHWLLEVAAQSKIIRGVVGWAPIASLDFPTNLEALAANKLLRGLRHVVQGEPEGFLDGPEFNRGIAAMKDTGLVYDVLIFARQLEEATRFVDRHPGQHFVLDHIAKPDIVRGGFDAWAAGFRELARRDNVTCKLSGMVTEADWTRWTPSSLKPYFDTALEAFGPSRLMACTDWPVLTVACCYAQWWEVIAGWTAALSPTERALIEGITAARTYHLQLKTEQPL